MQTEIEVSEAEKKIITTSGGSHLVIAPGGCGKTHFLKERVKHILKNGNGEKILCVTFTHGAATEMNNRLEMDLGEQYFNGFRTKTVLDIDTLHSICKKLLERHAHSPQAGGEGEAGELYPVLSEDENRDLIRQAFYNVMCKRAPRHRKTHRKYNIAKGRIEHPLSLICQKKHLKDVEDLYYNSAIKLYHTLYQKKIGMPTKLQFYPDYTEDSILGIRKYDWNLVKAAAIEYWKLKCSGSGKPFDPPYKCDFDDLLTIMWGHLNEGLIKPQYDWVQVDEVQDMSAFQLELIRMMTVATEQSTMFYFGDKNQAIFSFMGGCSENMDRLRESVGAENVSTLTCNRRSSAKLVQYQRHFINRFLQGKDKEKVTMTSWKGGGTKGMKESAVEIHHYATQKEQKEDVVKMVQKIVTELKQKREILKRPVTGEGRYEVAVLCRTNGECSSFEKAMLKAGVATLRLSNESFAEMKDTAPIIRAVKERLSKEPSAVISDVIREEVEKQQTTTPAMNMLLKYATPGKDFNEISSTTPDDIYNNGQIIPDVIISTVHKAKGKSFHTVIVTSVVKGNYPLTGVSRNLTDGLAGKETVHDAARIFYVAISRAEEKLILTYFDKGRLVTTRNEKFRKTSDREHHRKAKVSARAHIALGKTGDTRPSDFLKLHPRGTETVSHLPEK